TPDGRAQSAPTLASVTPTNGATLVPTTSSVVFVFDQEMDTSVFLLQTIPNALVGNFEVVAPGFNQSLIATWGADKKSITLKPAIQFPYATFTWRLNPAGSLFPLKSKSGVRLETVTGTFSTGIGGTAPVLVSSSPANDSIRVDPTTVVSFNFDQPMKTNTPIADAVAWTGQGLDASKFRYAWSVNGRGLLCDYEGNLPANTEIRWALNPANATSKLQNPAGLALPSGTYAGAFTTGSGIPCITPGLPPDWGSYSVFKTSSFRQDSSGDPVPSAESHSFNFGVVVQGPSLGPVATAGSLTYPDATRVALTALPGQFVQDIRYFDTEEAQDAATPAGNYTLRFTLGTLPESVATMALPAIAPPVPRIVNFDAGQNIRADADFTLTWNAFPGAGADDYISIMILDDRGRTRFSAPDPCVPIELPVTATSIVIPAKTFATNSLLTGTIIFYRGFYESTNAIPKMAGSGSILRNTQFSLRTLGGGGTGNPAAPARFSNPRLSPDGKPVFDIGGTPGTRYTIQRSGQVGSNANWSNASTVTLDAAGKGTAQDNSAPPTYPLFYRATQP
ncbi:MAG: Ig-like domain-containing protein, partial [Verrucomicrobiales bacterium]|nr:Ig-like domain-containing protein [Verrucomicrobiales bacterium]